MKDQLRATRRIRRLVTSLVVLVILSPLLLVVAVLLSSGSLFGSGEGSSPALAQVPSHPLVGFQRGAESGSGSADLLDAVPRAAQPQIGPREIPREQLPVPEPAPWVDMKPAGTSGSSDEARDPSGELTGIHTSSVEHAATTGSAVAFYSASQGEPVAAETATTPTEISSDDFNRLELGETWTFVDPLGNSVLELDGTNARISVPAGTSHDIWTDGVLSPRLMQTASDSDFEIEVKFETLPVGTNAMQGLLVEADERNFMRFDVYSSEGDTGIFAATFAGGEPSVRLNEPIAPGLPLYLRISRSGHEWDLAYQVDAGDWITAASIVHEMNVSQVGVFVGNAGSHPPAHTGSIDYFFNTDQPIDALNTDQALDTAPPVISQVEHEEDASSFTVTWWTDKPASSLVRYGTTSDFELGVVSDPEYSYFHEITIEDLEPMTTHQFEVESTGENGSTSTSSDPVFALTSAIAASEPVIDVWYGTEQTFGDLGNSQRWANILGRVSSPEGIASLSYSLNGGAPSPLSVGPNGDRLVSPGDFNIELDRLKLNSGENTVVITAVDTLSNTAQQTVTVTYVAGKNWQSPYGIDWSTTEHISDVAQVIDGLWTLTGDGVRPVEIGYDRLLGIGEVTWDDFEVEVPITIHEFGTTYPPAVGLVSRWAGHYPHDDSGGHPQPRWEWRPLGALGWYEWSNSLNCARLNIHGDTNPIVEDTSCRQLESGTPYIFKFRVETLDTTFSRYSFKVWEEGEPEPSDWDLVGNKGGELRRGSLLLVAQDMDATFGNVSIVPLAEPVLPLPDDGRVVDDLQALYTFEEGTGTTVHDVSGVGTPLDLQIEDPGSVAWNDGSLSVPTANRIASPAAASKLIDAYTASNSVTIEAWIAPSTASQGGPARVITLSNGLNNRNLMVGHGEPGGAPGERYDVRLRSTTTNSNGQPTVTSPSGSASAQLTHLVYTRSMLGAARIYLDGIEVVSGNVQGDLSNWDDSFRLALGNEIGADRPWVGTYHLVAFYNRALSGSEVAHNFMEGPDGEGFEPPPRVTWLEPEAGTVVSDTTALSVDAPEDTERVEFAFENGDELTLIGTAEGAGDDGSWSVEWDTTTVADGSYQLVAIAFDAATDGNVLAEASRSVTVRNEEASRITAGMVALYDFHEGSGSTVHDVSGVGTPLDLEIENAGSASWGEDSLSLSSPNRVASSGPASKLIDAAQASNALTLEAWIVPDAATQSGPARVVTMSSGLQDRNLTLGHGHPTGTAGTSYDVRLRTTSTNANGQPSLTSPANSTTTQLQHVLHTRSADGAARLYIDGVEVAADTIAGDLNSWNAGYRLALGNELGADRPWLGTYHLVAFYDRALTAGEVQINYEAGPDADSGGVDPPPPPPEVIWLDPSEGATLSDTARLSVDAPEDTQRVEFTFDEGDELTLIGTAEEAGDDGSWSVEWDTTTVSDGSYQLMATAFDAVTDGEVLAEASRSVTVRNEETSRVMDGLRALYDFHEGSGSTVHDVSGVGTPLDLEIENPGDASWGEGSLSLSSPNRVASSGPASKLIDAGQASNALTLEAWIVPDAATQSGPARVVTMSSGLHDRNLTLGQGEPSGSAGARYDLRLRTTSTNANGQPSLTSPANSTTTDLQHVLYTRSADGTARLYIDGVEVATGTVSGNLSSWNASYRLALGNELGADRPWVGTYHLVAFYDRALTAGEVQINYDAGPGAEPDNGDSNGPDPVEPETLSWQAFNTDWQVQNNRARMVNQHGQGRLLVDIETVNHAIEATIELPGGNDEHYAGLYVRYENELNFIHARYLQQSGNAEIEVFQRQNGADRLIIFVNFHQSVNGTTRTINLAAFGNEVAVYDNGALVGQGVTDLSNGTITGIGAFGNQTPAGIATWDDVTVSTSRGVLASEMTPPAGLLFHDSFLAGAEPPVVANLPASPGPGQWVVTNSADRLRINHDTLRISAAVGWGDPALWTSTSIPRDEFGALSTVVRIEGATHSAGVFISETQSPGDPLADAQGVRVTTRNINDAGSGLALGPPGPVTESANRSVDHLVSVIPREGGGKFLLASGGNYPQYPEAALLWVDGSGLNDGLYAGLSSSANTNVSFDDVRIIAASDVPDGFDSRYGVAVTSDRFDSEDSNSGTDLDGRTSDGSGQPWSVMSGSGIVNPEIGVLEQSGNLHAVVQSESGKRTIDATFTLGTGVKSFGVYIRSAGPGGGGVRFAYLGSLQAWVIIDDDAGQIWSTGANTGMISDGAEIRLTVIDDGEHIRAIANGVDLAGGSWIPLNVRSGASWAGIYSGTNDESAINEFVVWPATVQLNASFDAVRTPTDADQHLTGDSFDDPDGTDLDQRPLESE